MRLSSFAVVLAALALAPAAHAQLPSITVGVAGGPNFASLNNVANADLGSSTGYHVGVYGDVSLPFVAFRTGVYYLKAGNVETPTGAALVSANFITVPVDFRFQTPTPIVKAYALVGPEFRFPVGSASDVISGGPVIDRSSVNVAANIGVGASFKAPLVGPAAFLELRYSRDISGFASTVSNNVSQDYKVSFVQLRLGVGL